MLQLVPTYLRTYSKCEEGLSGRPCSSSSSSYICFPCTWPRFGAQSSSPASLDVWPCPLVFQGWLLTSTSMLSTSLWCSTVSQPIVDCCFFKTLTNGFTNEHPTFPYPCIYSRLWTENLTRTHSIKPGTQTTAYRGCEVSQGKGNTESISELWQRAVRFQAKTLKFNLRQNPFQPKDLCP